LPGDERVLPYRAKKMDAPPPYQYGRTRVSL
jgi:hypothetical protein